MKANLIHRVALGTLITSMSAFAGTDHSISRELAVSPPPTAKSGWEFAVSMPGWMTGIKGDIGVAGLNPVHVDLPFNDLLSHIDMVAALALEAQHDRWGFYVTGLYEKLGVDGDPPGRLLNSANLSLRQVIAEAGVTYRLWEGKRGYFDLLAGARYIYMDVQMNFDVSSSGVNAASQELVSDVVGRVSSAVRSAVTDVTSEIKGDLSGKLTGDVRSKIQGRVDDIYARHPRLPQGGPVRDAIQEVITARVAAAKGALTGAAAAAKAKLDSRVYQAEKKLANEIAAAVKNAIPQEVSGSKSWVDPFVGFRARYNFTDQLYAAVRADIGGFSVGSDLAWQAYGALGWQFNRHWSTELGYRYLSVDYESDGFVFDAAVAGAYLGITYKF